MATPNHLLALFTFTTCLLRDTFSTVVPCPFDTSNKCACTSDQLHPGTVWQDVECVLSNTSTLAPFTGESGTYIITGTFEIVSGKLGLSIPANAFLPFSSIRTLNFVSKNRLANLTLDPLALAGPPIKELFLKSYNILLPLPSALGLAGKSGLQYLSLQDGAGGPLGANAFQDFRNLSGLELYYTHITSIDDAAFAGLENTLGQLLLGKANLDAYPATAISKLGPSLQQLSLRGNGMKTYPKAAFAHLPKLVSLDLSQNDIQAAYDADAFDQFPPAVRGDLNLQLGGLTQIPKDIFTYAPLIDTLHLAGNKITALKSGDFARATALRYLDLEYNPIATIEPGSLDGLILLEELGLFKNQLQSFDLSLVEGMNSLAGLLFIDDQPLTNVTVPSPDKVPASVTYVEISSTALKTVDPNFQPILDRPIFRSMDLNKNLDMQCDEDLQWIASYVFCTKKINVKSKCGNIPHKTVLNYLKETVPNPCQ